MSNWLAHLVQERGLSSSAIGPYSAAVTEALRLAGHKLDAELTTVVRKGLTNTHPMSRTKYDETWDLDLLLTYWQQQPTPTDLDRLRDKALSLLAAAAVARASDLARIRRLDWDTTGVTLHIHNAKNSVGWAPPVRVDFLPADLRLVCAATALRDYLDATPDARQQGDPVFRALKPSAGHQFTAITAQTIAGCVLRVMQAAGVPDHFRPHSIRGAAVSKAAREGEVLDDIQTHGRWRSDSVFRAHYLRAVPQNSVSTTILAPSQQ